MAERRFIVAPRGGGKTASVLIKAQAEITRLTAELEHMTSELDDGQVLIAELLADTYSLLQKNSKLRELLHEIAVAGVPFDDPRIDYVEIQVDKDTMADLRAAIDDAKGE